MTVFQKWKVKNSGIQSICMYIYGQRKLLQLHIQAKCFMRMNLWKYLKYHHTQSKVDINNSCKWYMSINYKFIIGINPKWTTNFLPCMKDNGWIFGLFFIQLPLKTPPPFTLLDNSCTLFWQTFLQDGHQFAAQWMMKHFSQHVRKHTRHAQSKAIQLSHFSPFCPFFRGHFAIPRFAYPVRKRFPTCWCCLFHVK